MSDDSKVRLLFIVNVAWFFRSHRLPLAIAAISKGFEVHVACNCDDLAAAAEVAKTGCFVHHVPFSRGGHNPVGELRAALRLTQVFRKVRPQLVHNVTVKPVLMGTVLARSFRVRGIVNAVSGLGHIFSSRGLVAGIRRKIVRGLYKRILDSPNVKVILQNPDDVSEFLSRNIVSASKVVLIRGSGVDLGVFNPSPQEAVPLRVVFPARMLWAKGVAEFVEAAHQLNSAGVSAEFLLAGQHDPDNPGHVPLNFLKSLESPIRWLGHVSDMAGFLRQAAIVCLPSYYGEGVPKALIEAAACGKPIVTTDEPGCREVVRNGWNGILVPSRNSVMLANGLGKLLSDADMRKTFGKNSRQLAEREFAVESVLVKTLAIYEDLLVG